MSNKELKKYYKTVKQSLPCNRIAKKAIIQELKNNVLLFTDEQPEADIKSIIEHFGKPDVFAADYFASMSDEEQNKAMQKSKWVKRGVIIAVIAIVISATITTIWIINDNSKTMGYYYEEGIE